MIAARTSRTRHKIYLCNWFVKLVKPGTELLPNQVQCHVPMKYVVMMHACECACVMMSVYPNILLTVAVGGGL